MREEYIKPCPFCGNEEVEVAVKRVADGVCGRDLSPHNPNETFYRREEKVTCVKCKATTNSLYSWNQREYNIPNPLGESDVIYILQQHVGALAYMWDYEKAKPLMQHIRRAFLGADNLITPAQETK